MRKPFRNPASRISWMWALLPLLLAAALAIPLLDVDAFNGDEPKPLSWQQVCCVQGRFRWRRS